MHDRIKKGKIATKRKDNTNPKEVGLKMHILESWDQ
jgi:hypothetical protein